MLWEIKLGQAHKREEGQKGKDLKVPPFAVENKLDLKIFLSK